MSIQPYPTWDLNFILYLQHHLVSWVPFLKIVSIVISPPVIFVIAMVIFFLDKKKGTLCLIYLAIITFLALSLKDIIHDPRPYWASPYVIGYITPRDFGMPSGHALFGFFFIFLAFLYRKIWVASLGVIALVLVCLSRMTLGVHYVEQILAGIGLGILSTILAFALPKILWADQFNFRGRILVLSVGSLVVLIIFISLFLEFSLYFKPRIEWAVMVSRYTDKSIHQVNFLGIGSSFLFSFSLFLSLLLEKHYIHFASTKIHFKNLFIALLIGGIYILGLMIILALCALINKDFAILIGSFLVPYIFCFRLLLEGSQMGILEAKKKTPARLGKRTLGYRFRKLYVR